MTTKRKRGWGATRAEAVGALPGDLLVDEPAFQVTRAVTVDAPPASVWPWLMQLGADRGGFYSYEWLENLFRLGIHNTDELVAAWQHRAVGDVVWADAKRRGGWYVVESRSHEALVLQMANIVAGRPARRTDKGGFEFLWAFVLQPGTARGTTRLLVRERVAFGRPTVRLLVSPMGWASFVMTRRMLLGIKARAERTRLGRLVDQSAA